MNKYTPLKEEDFIPTTRNISPNPKYPHIVYRQIRSWHSNTYAGERLQQHKTDSSGCARPDPNFPDNPRLLICNIPLTVTHRIYWNLKNKEKTYVSAFLSYPDGMGVPKEYFWEALFPNKEDVDRYFGPDGEKEMEKDIVEYLKGD